MLILLGQNDQAHKLLRAGFREALVSTLLPQTVHEVKDRLAAQNLVAHVGAQHDARLVLEDGGHKARPNCQPANRYGPLINHFPAAGMCAQTHKHICSKPVLGNVEWIIRIVIMASDLLHV